MTLLESIKQFANNELDKAFDKVDGNYLSSLEDVFLKVDNQMFSIVIYDVVQEQAFIPNTRIPANDYTIEHICIDWYEDKQGELYGHNEIKELPTHIIELNKELSKLTLI